MAEPYANDVGSGVDAEVSATAPNHDDDDADGQAGQSESSEKNVTFGGSSTVVVARPRPKLERQSRPMRHIDIATGTRTTRTQSVVQIGEHQATQPRSRLQKMMFWKNPEEMTPSGRLIADTGVRQFRIRSYQKGDTWLAQVASRQTASLLSEFLRWTFKASFTQVMLASCCFFMKLIIMFSFFIWIIGQHQPQCISAGNADFKEAGTDFMDAYHLSWTSTFAYPVTVLSFFL